MSCEMLLDAGEELIQAVSLVHGEACELMLVGDETGGGERLEGARDMDGMQIDMMMIAAMRDRTYNASHLVSHHSPLAYLYQRQRHQPAMFLKHILE